MPNPGNKHSRTREANQAKILAAIAAGANTQLLVEKATGINANHGRKHLLRLVASGQVVKTVRPGAPCNPSTYAIAKAGQ